MRVELSIKSTYLPTWGAYEGVRELLQNGRDAEIELSAPLMVRHRKPDTLVICNEGAVLPHEALLMGHTSKADRSDLIGHWGEGMKLGLLALVRAGHVVKIRSGAEVWTPTIERSERFHADVLVFDIATGREPKERIAIEVGGISAEDWTAMKRGFLFLHGTQLGEHVTVDEGTLLLDEAHKGRVYVKGIFVAAHPDLTYGYDLADATIDRDRKMVEKYDLQYRTQRIWRQALAARPDVITAFGRLLAEDKADVQGIESYNATNLPDAAKQAVVADFQAKHGASALPVATFAESADIEHLGKRGIVCPKPLRAVLEAQLGSAPRKRKRRSRPKLSRATPGTSCRPTKSCTLRVRWHS